MKVREMDTADANLRTELHQYDTTLRVIWQHFNYA